MNAIRLAASVVGCLCLATIFASVSVESKDIRDLEGFFWDNRPLLGHFRRSPYIDIHELYKTYAASFIKPLFPDRAHDDFRNYLPSGDDCMQFFSKFRIDKYTLRDLDDFVVMDACLGYLYEAGEFHQKDMDYSQQVRENLNTWLADEKLREMYHNTQVDELSFQAKECISNLMYDMILAKRTYPDEDCNADYLKVFLDFAKCHRVIPSELRHNDAYLHPMYELVRNRGRKCFHKEINNLNVAVRGEYANNLFFRGKTGASKKAHYTQANQRMWPKKIVELLKAVQNPSKGQQINMREVSRLVRGVAVQNQILVRRLLGNMGEYSTNKVIYEKYGKSLLPDPLGQKRYLHLVDDLCNFFRPSDNPKFYDYTTPFARMVRMLEYPEVFDISQKYFVNEVLNQSFETGVLYLSVSSCNLLTFTEAQFAPKAANGKDKYEVVFKPDTKEMIMWPDTGFW